MLAIIQKYVLAVVGSVFIILVSYSLYQKTVISSYKSKEVEATHNIEKNIIRVDDFNAENIRMRNELHEDFNTTLDVNTTYQLW